MTTIQKPLEESYDSDTFTDYAGRTQVSWSEYRQRQHYVDTQYALKNVLGIPLSPLPLKFILYDIDDPITHVDKPGHRYDGRKCNHKAAWGNPITWPGTSAAIAAEDQMVEFLHKKLAKINTFNASVALLELKETAGLISSTATRIGLAYRHLKKGRVNDAFSMLDIKGTTPIPKDVKIKGLKKRTASQHKRLIEKRQGKHPNRYAAESWLEMRYGWTPLLMDVYGGAEAVAKLINDSTYDFAIRATGKYESKTPIAHTWYGGENHHKVTYTGVWKFKVTDSSLRNMSSLGLTNPAHTAWELVPFSFVVDWFVPIGDYLQGFSLMHGLTVSDSHRTIVKETIGHSDTYDGGYGGQYPGHIKGHYLDIERSINMAGYCSEQLPTSRAPLSDFLNTTRTLDALSLLRVVFGR